MHKLGRFKDEIQGKRFVRWRVLSFDKVTPSGHAWWICECDCGTKKSVMGSRLKRGESRSCGCLKNEEFGNRTRTHGEAIHGKETPEYITWSAMISRCTNSKHKQWDRYGGRGILVCERWLADFSNFLSDMGRRPSNKHSIDRRDNDKGYRPDNCRWATKLEQALNTSTNAFVTVNGIRQTLIEWQRQTGLGEATIRARIRRGWTPEQAVSVPADSFKPLKKRSYA